MFSTAWQAIYNSKSIVLASHINPDCDTLGSSLAVYDVLKSLKKEVYLFNATEELPRKLRFLPHFEEISSQLPSDFETLVVFDCAKFERTGLDLDRTKKFHKIVNIDHHLTNTNFGDINLVKSDYPSCALVVYQMLKTGDLALSKAAAGAIYAGSADDTGFFSYGCLSADTFRSSAELIELGADPILISRALSQSVPLARFRLKERVMRDVDLLKNAKVALVVITQNDLNKSGAKREDTEDIINIVRELVSVELAVMILEEEDGSFKVSLRSKQLLDVSKIALKFGGGGHFGAAGFESKKSADEITADILNEFDKRIQVDKTTQE